MINIPKRQEPQTTELYYNGDHIATIDHLQFLKIRLQIKELGIIGYTITHNNTSYPIYPDGKIEYPKGLFDEEVDLLFELL